MIMQMIIVYTDGRPPTDIQFEGLNMYKDGFDYKVSDPGPGEGWRHVNIDPYKVRLITIGRPTTEKNESEKELEFIKTQRDRAMAVARKALDRTSQ